VPICLTCSREIPPTSAFCAYCGSPNPEATPSGYADAAASDVEALRWRPVRARTP